MLVRSNNETTSYCSIVNKISKEFLITIGGVVCLWRKLEFHKFNLKDKYVCNKKN